MYILVNILEPNYRNRWNTRQYESWRRRLKKVRWIWHTIVCRHQNWNYQHACAFLSTGRRIPAPRSKRNSSVRRRPSADLLDSTGDERAVKKGRGGPRGAETGGAKEEAFSGVHRPAHVSATAPWNLAARNKSGHLSAMRREMAKNHRPFVIIGASWRPALTLLQ